ncbi:hypothetical protein DPMN_038166 [Dreissena polymorpha]|uniref:Uncharacterized protein n=1 Tax=Dreissena polymorpha TaxID=45954 RepID=A0A9D4MEX7_DREPO|nr:hypothetical protein DPMN_038166 [Dreissena polymorpha]
MFACNISYSNVMGKACSGSGRRLVISTEAIKATQRSRSGTKVFAKSLVSRLLASINRVINPEDSERKLLMSAGTMYERV